MEIALIAFDGLDPRVLYENRDRLSAFDAVMDEGLHGKWSTPGHTIPSFTATLTGEVYDEYNFHWDRGKGGHQRHRQVEHDYLWDTVDSSMTLLNMPTLYPPEDIDDVMVCGFLVPDELKDSQLARPQAVQDYLNEVGYIHDVAADRTYDEMGPAGMRDHLIDMMEGRTEVAKKLAGDYNSDLFYGIWSATDRWFHQCQKYGHDIMPLYEQANAELDKMLSFLPNDIPIIIFSDHGFAHFPEDSGVHKGHMHEGWYCATGPDIRNARDDHASIFDLYPTIVNYLTGEMPEQGNGRIMFYTDEQRESVRERGRDLGYME